MTIESRDDGTVTARMVAVRPVGRLGLPVSWRAQHWVDESEADDLRLHFRHLGGVTGGMAVSWHIRPSDVGSHVTIEHDFSRPLPVVGTELLPRLVDRFFVRPIAGRTLATFKALAEGAR